MNSKKEPRDIVIKEFKIEEMYPSCTWIIIGVPGSGKTTLIENLAYYHKNRYPVARVMVGTEGGYKRFCGIFQPLFVSNSYDEMHEKTHILRQRTCALDGTMEKSQGKYAINILDDVSDDTKIYRTKTMNALFKLGSQHYNQCFIIGTQYAIDVPPQIRRAVSYVALFKEPNEIERKKLYQNFGGICGTYDDFCDLMDQLTGDYTCMIIDKRSQSSNREDCVFWYRTVLLGDWKFGCKEYREWNNTRYNPNYVEKILI